MRGFGSLATEVVRKCAFSPLTMEHIVKLVFDTITDVLAKEGSLELPGFGTFKVVREKAGRKGLEFGVKTVEFHPGGVLLNALWTRDDTEIREARTQHDLVARLVARLWRVKGREVFREEVIDELRRAGLKNVSEHAIRCLRRAEKKGLVRRANGGWVPAEAAANDGSDGCLTDEG